MNQTTHERTGGLTNVTKKIKRFMALTPYYEQVGQGSNLVLLHGWGIHGGIFEHLYPHLAQHFRIINIDLPGFGRSPVPNAPYTIELLAQQVLSVAPEKAHYLGWSLGGLLAKYIAIHHPTRVDKLITVASNPQFLIKDDWPYAMQPKVMENFVTMLEDDYETTLIRFLAIQTMGSETQKQDIQRLKETVFLHGQPAKKALRGGLDILNTVDLRQQLSKIQQPTLRIYGKLDGLVPIKAVEKINALFPASQVLIFNKASHAPFLSHGDRFCEQVIQFIEQGKLDQTQI
jgi:pimeloyl-[acyl-carrier protein] methyl ester esterase